MRRRDSWSAEEWIDELDKVIEVGGRWLGGLPPRSEGENPAVNAAKQLAEEVCEFASSVSAAAQRSHWVSAYANLRPLVDRLFHAARFFEEPENTVAWFYWSTAEINRLVSNALSQGSVNGGERDGMRSLLNDFRHWNRTECGKDQKMLKPRQYAWHDISRAMTGEANSRLRNAFDITSTYVHPTYRGHNAPDPEVRYVMGQAVWMTCATIIIFGAALMHGEDDWDSCGVDGYLMQVVELLDTFFDEGFVLAGKVKNPFEGMSSAQVLYLHASMLVEFVFGREVIEGLPRIK